jgi:hypothetical protein
MTALDKIWAIALGNCTFVPGTATKRFARDMAFAAQHDGKDGYERILTLKQREYLRTAVIRFRRQIDPSVVDSAREVMK